MNNTYEKSSLFEPCSSSCVSFSGVHNNEHKCQHPDCPACRKALERLKIRNKGVILYMMSLPISSRSFTSTNPQTSFHPGRNLPDTPFRQFAHDGISKREFMPHRSSNPYESVSDEINLLITAIISNN